VARLADLEPGQMLEARIAPSGKGLTAVELRGLDGEASGDVEGLDGSSE
jgi:hypothetical protein